MLASRWKRWVRPRTPPVPEAARISMLAGGVGMSDPFLQNCSLWGLLLQAADEKESENRVDKNPAFSERIPAFWSRCRREKVLPKHHSRVSRRCKCSSFLLNILIPWLHDCSYKKQTLTVTDLSLSCKYHPFKGPLEDLEASVCQATSRCLCFS